MTLGLYIGRFQPIHLGHISALRQLLAYHLDHTVLAIGSSNAPISIQNPRTVSQRKQLIVQSIHVHFPDHHIDIVELADQANDEDRVSDIQQHIHPSHILTGNTWTIQCFEHEDVQIMRPMFEHTISATQIREAWLGQDIGSVSKYIDPHVRDFLIAQYSYGQSFLYV